jgi:hypothetical protein
MEEERPKTMDENELKKIEAKQKEEQFRFFLSRCLDNVAVAIKESRVVAYSTARVKSEDEPVTKSDVEHEAHGYSPIIGKKKGDPATKEDIEHGRSSLRITFDIEDPKKDQPEEQPFGANVTGVPAEFLGKKE